MANEWIAWGGFSRPVDAEAIVDLKLRNGDRVDDRRAGDLNWVTQGKGDDIVVYRLAASTLAQAPITKPAAPDDLFSAPGYEKLAKVLAAAYLQASEGKGHERHAQGQPFDQQPMQQLIKLYGVGFALGQAAKKAQESQRLPTIERQVAELLGSIVYICGAIIAIENGETKANG